MKCEAGHSEYNPLCVCCDQLEQELDAALEGALLSDPQHAQQRIESNVQQRSDSNGEEKNQ